LALYPLAHRVSGLASDYMQVPLGGLSLLCLHRPSAPVLLLMLLLWLLLLRLPLVLMLPLELLLRL
jgi:hypothetical protein